MILRRQGMRNVEGVIMEKKFFQTNYFQKVYVGVDSLRVKLQCYLVVSNHFNCIVIHFSV